MGGETYPAACRAYMQWPRPARPPPPLPLQYDRAPFPIHCPPWSVVPPSKTIIFVGNVVMGSPIPHDPADPDAAMRAADELQLDIVAILTTHKHEDHTAGNKRIACDLPGLPVYGPIECKEKEHAITHFVREGDAIEIGSTKFTVMETPYHTSGHISYFAERPAEADVPPALFCGDALFVGGCGRFFEGDAQIWWRPSTKYSIATETEVFCGRVR